MKKYCAALFSFALFASLVLPANAESSQGLLTELQLNPEITIEVLDKNEAHVNSADVLIFSLTEDNNKVVFNGKTDKDGKYILKSTLSDEEKAKQKSPIAVAAYEVYALSPEGEMSHQVFSVPHLKNSSQLTRDDRIALERDRVKTISTKFKGQKPQLKKNGDEVSTLAVGDCVPFGGGNGYTVCTTYQNDAQQPTKIISVNLGSNESASVSMASSASVKIDSGFKQGSGSWTVSGNTTLSTDTGTAIDYTVNGQCIYNNGTYCDAGVDLYANYMYRSIKRDIKYFGSYQWSDYSSTALYLIGPSSTYNWYTSSLNGISPSSVTGGSYGAYFSIYNDGSVSATATKSYSAERTLGGAFSVPTPGGTFTGGVTTSYKNSHSIKWSVPNVIPGLKYYHYDNNFTGTNWYVTH
ncbi:hypothetical protein HZF08_29685 [Paenibacillus sp. CGMCC 1.16610]|uniref:Uncharacterized protein n=2 Tax=Paenibacillus TaxID=44249 RepID=A0ABW9U843_9BACL|nr:MULTISPECIES: hypothetical protein [Paenibacillus]MBA2942451.1 hypothetical protein [Paenibacillus sp. CGMCC 1.16610]MVQ34525.1 hypothetical protein [Paenibacillus anseongense]